MARHETNTFSNKYIIMVKCKQFQIIIKNHVQHTHTIYIYIYIIAWFWKKKNILLEKHILDWKNIFAKYQKFT